MVSNHSEDATAMARGFLNHIHVDPQLHCLTNLVTAVKIVASHVAQL